MIIKNEKPPIWVNVCTALNINPKNVLFTYGDIIYNPDGVNIPDHIIVHEEVHEKQQSQEGMTPELWWGKFLRDIEFRIDQESEAYAVQYRFFCKHKKDRNQRNRFLVGLAQSLSGPLYGKSISYIEAMQLIRKRANVS